VNEDDLKESLKKKYRYFKLRSKITQRVYAKADEGFDKELGELVQRIGSGELDGNSKEVQDARHKLEYQHLEVLREAMLIMFCSLMEEVLRNIAKICVPNCEDETSKRKRRGNWLKKHLNILKQEKSIIVNQKEVSFFQYFIKLRNCVVHGGGNVNKSEDAKLQEAISSLQKYGKENGPDMLGILGDGYFWLGRDFIDEVMIRCKKIMDEIFKCLLR